MLGCYGHKSGLSPHIDQLANAGIRFDQAISGGSWTQAAFPTILTSTYASMNGGCLGALAAERPSPIEALQQQGYATGGFVTSPLLGQDYGYDRGFSHFVELPPGESDPFLRRTKGGEKLLRLEPIHHIAKLFGAQSRPARLYATAAELTASFTDWIEKINSPFFAWLHYMDIHWPYHQEETLTTPHEIAQAWRDLSHLHRINRHGALLTPEQKSRYIALYEEAVRYTDAQIGALLTYLERKGIRDDTAIFLVADHGEEFFERNRWGHFETNLHDEIIKVPLIITLPNETLGMVVSRQVRTLDLMPTALALCQVSPPAGMEGEDLAPLWNGINGYESVESISERWRKDEHIIAIRTEKFKFIWDKKEPDVPKLFNLLADPEERENVASKFPDELTYFTNQAHAHLQKMAGSTPSTDQEEPDLDDAVLKRLRDLGYVT